MCVLGYIYGDIGSSYDTYPSLYEYSLITHNIGQTLPCMRCVYVYLCVLIIRISSYMSIFLEYTS